MKKFAMLMIASVLLATPAMARMKYMKQFKAAYPNATALFDCTTCHEGEVSDGVFNAYGTDFENANFDIRAIEQVDSDGDGVKNIDEINANTPPGVK